jgi:type IV secretion system protein VirB9
MAAKSGFSLICPTRFKSWVSPRKARRIAWGLGRNRPNARSAKSILAGLFFCALMLASPVWATRVSRPIGTDSRIHVVMYTPDEVIKYVGHYGYQSSIIFEEDEEIQTISMGDPTPWMIIPAGNRMFLKPIDQDAQTNMTLITNKRSYLFELHAREAESIDDPNLVWVMRFVYPSDPPPPASRLDEVPDPERDGVEKYNLNYTIRGSDYIAPIKIFDDGEFTYFEFNKTNADLPAFYMVDQWGKESIVNYRTRGNYIVVERVASRFTLRKGSEVLCVYNEARPFPPKALGADRPPEPPM